MFRDEQRDKVCGEIRQHGLRCFGRLLPEEVFAQAAERASVRTVDSPLSHAHLVFLGISAAIYQMRNFASVLVMTLKLLRDAPEWSTSSLGIAQRQGEQRRAKARKAKRGQGKRGKADRRSPHDPRRDDPTQISEEAFCQARQRMPLGFWMALLLVLTERFERQHGEWLRWKSFRLLAIDGTTIDLPGYKPLAEHFGTAKNGTSRGHTQARMVMVQCPLARLPWRYAVQPLSVGERTVAQPLLEQLRPDDLLLMDRGFWSYGLFHTVARQNAYFAIRLYARAKLKTVRRLGDKDRLVQCDKPRTGRWLGKEWPKSMILRVIDYQLPGFRRSAVVTNMLNPQRVSRDNWVRLATQVAPGSQRLNIGLYHRRWEIETTFRELKVHQGLEGGLRSRRPESIQYEIAGHVLLYLLTRWLIVEAAIDSGQDPLQLSFKAALGELIDMQQTLLLATPQRVAQVLLPRLLSRIACHEIPFRPGRHFPRPHDTQIKNLGYGNYKQPHKLSRKR